MYTIIVTTELNTTTPNDECISFIYNQNNNENVAIQKPRTLLGYQINHQMHNHPIPGRPVPGLQSGDMTYSSNDTI